MSNLGPMAGGRQPQLPTPPRGEPIARYDTYLEAQRAVDFLSDSAFPVQFVTIVGSGLRMVERVTGRLTYPRVAAAGAASGAWFGLFVGVLLSFFGSAAGGVIFVAVLFGAAFGMLFGVISYALTGGRRDFTSTSQIVASEYEVLCMPEQAQAARDLLLRLPGGSGRNPWGSPVPAPSPPTQPQRPADLYGPPPVGPPSPGAPPEAGAPAAPEPPVTGPTYGEMIEKQKRERQAREQQAREEQAREQQAREQAARPSSDQA
jgi:hypothetical protein